MNDFNKGEEIFKELWSHKFKLAAILFAVAVISFAATFLIRPKYKSISIVFPVNLFPTSDESSTEQLMQYFNSSDVKWDLAKKFKLFEYYGIDTTKEQGGKALFDYMYKENISISPTLYESIEITVKDVDPHMAQEINGGILELTNNLVKNNKKYILYQYIKNIDKTIDMQRRSIDSVLNIAKQDELFLNEDVKALDGEKKKSKKIKKLKERDYTEKIKGLNKSYGRIVYKRDKFYMDYAGDLTFFSIVSHPTKADKRCYPIRSLIVITSVISTLVFSLLIILIRYRIRQVKNV
jgi:hypothetical protein